MMDVNKDGVVQYQEFNYFVKILLGNEPGQLLINQLKMDEKTTKYQNLEMPNLPKNDFNFTMDTFRVEVDKKYESGFSSRRKESYRSNQYMTVDSLQRSPPKNSRSNMLRN